MRIQIIDVERHRGCVCDEGFEGNYCEFEKVSESPTGIEPESSNKTYKGLMSVAGVLIASILIIFLTYLKYKRSSVDLQNQSNGELA